MLTHLAIKNLALIEELILVLEPGFNVITGETGTGKSMLVDALSLVLGARVRPDLLRSGAKEAEVEAQFRPPPGSHLVAWLAEAGIPFDGELVVRRVFSEGKSRAYVNGKLCTAAQLAEWSPEMCDISSQHESVKLTDPATHTQYLDAYARLDDERALLAERVAALHVFRSELADLREKLQTKREQLDYLEFQLKEIDELNPQEGEEETLEQERGRLRHSEKLSEVTSSVAALLYDSEHSICDMLGRVSTDLDSIREFDPSLDGYLRIIDDARAELSDVARALSRYSDGVEANPERLSEIEERFERLRKLLRKHGPQTRSLLAFRDDTRKSLALLQDGDSRAIELETQERQRLAEAAVLARKLSAKRRKAAETMADAVGHELAQLGMGRAKIIVDVAQQPATAGSLSVDGHRLGPNGMDRVEFLIAPNRGEEPKPLRRIASGGELSRSLLALKRVLAEQGPAGMYIFDEVDTGVGGAVAEVIGRSIAEIAKHRQVLCITHLPQIAALATSHYVVEKREVKGRTFAGVRKLSEAERIDEVARMLGGVRVTEATKTAATELLRMGQEPGAKPAKPSKA
jgi:DNA repair protein RecN (Recombination protein N)